ncbi:uncharacterized protein ASPGLDRAFT_207848 [Aspergillus glaucus CBS 516.65]|uniref:Uncharacterized protein n=1 Tax=Aspergillus glaucus CBS 516.65 TaxID=1160497 RepID=A0A1L9VZ04_ASPGL|nr:hypothetical protein ASPGLDRAFT_207848 [Aspergillus glaucus CBS 516.65]OJJ89160.1 hypothetical protein ASPGLDRAFT_207848 [Aspergillus glaucus CBS 516.65]
MSSFELVFFFGLLHCHYIEQGVGRESGVWLFIICVSSCIVFLDFFDSILCFGQCISTFISFSFLRIEGLVWFVVLVAIMPWLRMLCLFQDRFYLSIRRFYFDSSSCM